MTDKGFHYMSERNWDELNRDKVKAITPRTRLIRLNSITDPDIPELPDWAYDAYIFAFPNVEAPEPWKKYAHEKDEWDRLTKNIGYKIIGFKFNILPTDEAYVIDRAHYADFQWKHNTDKQDAIKRYALSRIPVQEYDGSFRMPELLIKNPIELERLVIISKFQREIIPKDEEYEIKYIPIL